MKTHIIATPDENNDSIKTGQTTLPIIQSYDVTGVDPSKKLTVVEIRTRYFDNKGSKPLDFTYPFAA